MAKREVTRKSKVIILAKIFEIKKKIIHGQRRALQLVGYISIKHPGGGKGEEGGGIVA